MTGVLIRDLWTPVWPNLAASVLWTVPALAWHHRRIRRHIAEQLLHHRRTPNSQPENGE